MKTAHEDFQNVGFNLDFRLKLTSLGPKLLANETVKSGPLVVLKLFRKNQNFDSWTEEHGQESKPEETKPRPKNKMFPSYSPYFKFSFHFSFFSKMQGSKFRVVAAQPMELRPAQSVVHKGKS